MANGVDIEIDARDLRKISRMAKEFGPELRRQMLRQLRAAGQLGAQAAKEGILAMPSKGADDHELRQLVANAITVSVTTTRNADIRIQVKRTPALKAAGLDGIAKAINKGRWRHPVFAKKDSKAYKNPKRWVNQSGPEFFDKKLEEMQPVMEKAALEALVATRDIIVAQGDML